MTKHKEAPEGLRGEDPAADTQIESNRPPASKPAAIKPEDALALPVAPTAEARPEGATAAEAKTSLNMTGGSVAKPRDAVNIVSNRQLNQLPEGQVPAPPVDPTPTPKEVAKHNQEHTKGFGKE